MSAVLSHFSATTCGTATRVYRRRRPERTALYRVVQQHLETWLPRRRESDADGAPLPRHVERELRGYLECGILACGFARARCGACGHDFLVEHVFPQVPVRQWVITFPRRPRYFLHRDPALLGRVRRCVLRTIESGLRRRCPNAPHDSRFGAASFVQLFGSALNAHTHLHCCVTDGMFSLAADGTLRFHPAVDLDAAAVGAVRIEAEDRAGLERLLR